MGRAAIIGWRDVLAPALREEAARVAIWPFNGALQGLLRSDDVVVAETYPTEFYAHLGVSFPPTRAGRRSGKRVQADRQANASALLDRAATLGALVDKDLRMQMEDGFGPSRDGEDRFDAVVGLFGMLNVLLGNQPVSEPESADVRAVEGWILGQPA